SAHTAEETVGAEQSVPRGIVRSVLVSGIAGWILLCAIVLALPSPAEAAAQGERVFAWLMDRTVGARSPALALALNAAIALAQYLCGLATVTSASRMAFAFARDGGLPGSRWLRRVHARWKTPVHAIWTVSLAAVLFTLWAEVYATITAVCVIFL